MRVVTPSSLPVRRWGLSRPVARVATAPEEEADDPAEQQSAGAGHSQSPDVARKQHNGGRAHGLFHGLIGEPAVNARPLPHIQGYAGTDKNRT